VSRSRALEEAEAKYAFEKRAFDAAHSLLICYIRRATMAEEKLALVERWASQYEVADKSALDDLAFILKLKGELASPQA
jgi:hypothetical protein